MDTVLQESVAKRLVKIYKNQKEIPSFFVKLEDKLSAYKPTKTDDSWVSEKDVMLITYGDSLYKKDEKPLKTLKDFLEKYVKNTISSVHILPMFPFTSDDGFSVVDYCKINEELGNWSDIDSLSQEYKLMFDAVINHISKSSEWFKEFLDGNPEFSDYFIVADPSLDYSKVTRPRALPLLTSFDTNTGEKFVWTTFSEDQIDLNYKSMDLLIEVIYVLVAYAKKGAKYIRLDAVGFMWKELDSTCMHLEETHELIKLMREIVQYYVPGTILITETNVPHDDNISYFGNGSDEAQMVYQFPLPPLTLFSFLVEDATKLNSWASTLKPVSSTSTYFNFLASHDGIGMRPTESILTQEEKQILVDNTLSNGGRVSFKNNSDGTKSPYELNINYNDALTSPNASDLERESRFIAAQTILLSVVGMPGIYIHSLLGSRNYYYGVETSGINRRINREKINVDDLVQDLSEDTSRNKIFNELLRRIEIRKNESAFHPNALQKVLNIHEKVFSIVRYNEDTGKKIVVLVNVSNQEVLCDIEFDGKDLISGLNVKSKLTLKPLQSMWIQGE